MKHLFEKTFDKIYTTLNLGTLHLKLYHFKVYHLKFPKWKNSSLKVERAEHSCCIYRTSTQVKVVPCSYSWNGRGISCMHEPVIIAPADDKPSIISAIKNALDLSNHKTFEQFPNFDLRKLKVRSWKELYRTHEVFELYVHLKDKKMVLQPMKEVPHQRGLVPDADSTVSFDVDDYEGLVAKLLSL
ncbi:MAG: hypothetical protein IJ183_06005 [Prevotella sp.]|nr:hypothetical protein [Prevotella sp.]MBQ9237444.1 hypothetical protein [Prevotella sp.]